MGVTKSHPCPYQHTLALSLASINSHINIISVVAVSLFLCMMSSFAVVVSYHLVHLFSVFLIVVKKGEV